MMSLGELTAGCWTWLRDKPRVDDFVAGVDVSPVVLLGDDDVNPVWESVLTNQYKMFFGIP